MKLNEITEGLFNFGKKPTPTRTFPKNPSTSFVSDTRKDTDIEDADTTKLRVTANATKNAKKRNDIGADWTFS